MAKSHYEEIGGPIDALGLGLRPPPLEPNLTNHEILETSFSAYWGEQLNEGKDQLNNVLEAMKGKKKVCHNGGLVQMTDFPFSSDMMGWPLPQKFRIPRWKHSTRLRTVSTI